MGILKKKNDSEFDVPNFLGDGTRHRTQRLNSAITLMYQNTSKLQEKKWDKPFF